jgi:hypothetical protein
MRLFSYIVSRDFGFAPNPFHKICTLATCKPDIRARAYEGDWIVGTGSLAEGRQPLIVYMMRVDGAMTFEEYWDHPNFQKKKPNLRGSNKYRYGDNIYYRDAATGLWGQVNSHHSHKDGTPNIANIQHDTRTNRILYGSRFAYWGGRGPVIPPQFLAAPTSIIVGRGYRSRFDASVASQFVIWFESLRAQGLLGSPSKWK